MTPWTHRLALFAAMALAVLWFYFVGRAVIGVVKDYRRLMRRERIDARYRLDAARVRARNMPDTAAAIEAERAEWLATLDATGND